MLKIKNLNIKAPSVFQVDIQDIDDESNRNAKGKLLRDRIAVKRKLNCEWPPLTFDECSKLLNAVSDVFFNVYYPDPMTGNFETKRMYVGDRSVPALYMKDGKMLWKGLKMNFIEE